MSKSATITTVEGVRTAAAAVGGVIKTLGPAAGGNTRVTIKLTNGSGTANVVVGVSAPVTPAGVRRALGVPAHAISGK